MFCSAGDFVADTMGDKAEADYEKAAGLRSVVGEEGQRTIPRRCGEKRLFTDEVRSKFPHAFQRVVAVHLHGEKVLHAQKSPAFLIPMVVGKDAGIKLAALHETA